ncbi:hypothetical protein ASD02_32230 [Ensifer sp. Root1252]|nr:hypothetical protein ASD02_32230 [Ensifer sp. Root1252]KRC54252.1 hypothetical protein ASE32_22280 [Ensifer sp. Root231]KRD01586.1 hypothetical protein ASE47_21655 [Ensifer sp. Root258]
MVFSFVPIDTKNRWQSPLFDEERAEINSAVGSALAAAGLFDADRRRILVAILAGNIHNALGLIQQKPAYDVIIPSRPDLTAATGARIVPAEQILSHFRQHYRPFVNFLKLATKMAQPDKVFWVEPPPPIESSDHIAANMDHWFRSNYSESDLVPALPQLRYKLWLLNRIVLQEAASEGGWALITCPSAAQDSNGFLTRKAWAGDATHGSAWYGEELLKKIKAEIAHTL